MEKIEHFLSGKPVWVFYGETWLEGIPRVIEVGVSDAYTVGVEDLGLIHVEDFEVEDPRPKITLFDASGRIIPTREAESWMIAFSNKLPQTIAKTVKIEFDTNKTLVTYVYPPQGKE